MSRIPLTTIEPKTLKRLSELGGKPLNLYKLLAHHPRLLSAWIEFAYTLRKDCLTSRKLRELMILRGAQVSRAEYEWIHHLRMAKEAGVTEQQIENLSNWEKADSSIFSKEERLVMKFMECILFGKVPEEVSTEILNHFTPAEYVELTLTASFYTMVPRVLESLTVPLD